MKNVIGIEPYFFGPRGTASRFEVRVMSGPPDGDGILFDCHLWDTDETIEFPGATVTCTQAEWDSWTDDNNAFFALLATKAGYVPLL